LDCIRNIMSTRGIFLDFPEISRIEYKQEKSIIGFVFYICAQYLEQFINFDTQFTLSDT
jgi:hypothetical protein